MFASMTLLVLPTLLPVNYTATSTLATVVNLILLRLLLLEFRAIVHMRQSYLHHPSRANAVTTILITEIPPHMWKSTTLKQVYTKYNGGTIDVILPKKEICDIKEIELNDLLKTLEGTRQNLPEKFGFTSTFWKSIKKTTPNLYFILAIYKLRKEVETLKSVAILRFPDLFTAHLVLQARASSAPLKMNAIAIDGEALDELSIYQNWRVRAVRILGTTAALNTLAIFWAIPIAMTGLLSQLVYLDAISPSLNVLSNRQISAIQGLAPQAALSILMYCFPLIIQLLAKSYPQFEQSEVEILIQRYYFVFLYIQATSSRYPRF
ncbi:hypothetical protein SI65_05994 [Aspergillus cristatus]|uniref:CSC1/OSCA1-like 7TM region domain-containing protein n=1 Tax=Aspergillus cristatus TaxID=573508 RepID=A0A1E3BAW1_ASPCR|nr:hypothetical protein SI65_05994 [Aspergillus cristatus]